LAAFSAISTRSLVELEWPLALRAQHQRSHRRHDETDHPFRYT